MNLTNIQRQQLINKYPYLQVRNVWTGDIIDTHEIAGEYSLPEGWFRLFLLTCNEIYPILCQHNFLHEFYFLDIKEKYGTMRIYTSGAPEQVLNIIDLNSAFSEYVCQRCGSRATLQTTDWIASYCDHCSETIHDKKVPLKEPSCYSVIRFSKEQGQVSESRTYKHLKRKYKYIMTLTDDEFVAYLLGELDDIH